MSFKNISGESKAITEEMAAPWTETTLPTILSRYPLENIFNADEFGLFYQCLPNKTLHLKGEKCSGGKHSKIRLTGLVAGNAYGERLSMFVIGKANKPRCFKRVRNLPCRYRAQRKSWMTAELFEEWVRELDCKFSAAKRKIALIIDNCTAHPHVEQLASIELIFMPPNTTSDTQPMDQSVIRALKAKYRSLVVRKLIAALEKKNPVPTISILSAMVMLEKAWNAVSNKTFSNCFKKASISQKEVERVLNDEDDPFTGLDDIEEDTVQTLEANIAVLKEKFVDHVDADITTDDYVDFDIEVMTNHGKLTNQEILAEINGDLNEESDDEEENPNDFEPMNKPRKEDARETLKVLEDFSLFSTFGESMLNSLKHLNFSLDKEELSQKKQSVITRFFSKK